MADIDFSKVSILVVDDVPLNLLLVEKMLAHLKFKIRKADGGEKALAMVKESKPDVILLDLMMPKMDGFQVLEHLRSDPETKDIRVIILSALNSDADIVKGFKAGANDFITKPIIMERLIGSVKKQLEEIMG